MIIDFHTHTFPDKIAKQALSKLSDSAKIPYYTDGTIDNLTSSMRKAGIDMSVLLPVVTKTSQTHTVNESAQKINEHSSDTNILSFGGIHPDNPDYRKILSDLSQNGFRGIKLHPVFQNTYFDDIRYLRIVECACENDLIIVVHAGYDISFPECDYVTPKHILPVIRQLAPRKLVLAHMGGWNCWDEAEELLCSDNIYFDTSFSLAPIPTLLPRVPYAPALSNEQFLRIVRKAGISHILFGTDSPWSNAGNAVDIIRKTGLTEEELESVFYKNAQKLLFGI